MPVDYTKLIVRGTVIKCRRRWRRWWFDNQYLVKLTDGSEVWYWEDELDYDPYISWQDDKG